MTTRRIAALLAGLGLLASACSESAPASEEDAVAAGACSETSTVQAADPAPDPAFTTLPGGIREASLQVSASAFACAADVVVAPAGDPEVLAVAARLAAGVGGPLLVGGPPPAPEEEAVPDESLAAELQRLAPLRIHAVGYEDLQGRPEFSTVVSLPADPAALAAEVTAALGAAGTVDLPRGGGLDALVALVGSIRSGAGVTLTAAPAAEMETVPFVTIGSGISGALWLADADSPGLALPAVVAAAVSDGKFAVVDGEDLRRLTPVATALRQSPRDPDTVYLLGEITGDADWQLDVLLRAEQVPGGGFLMAPGKRMVALYGNPNTTSLGPLGEQGPEESAERTRGLAEPYGADGFQVIPTFEIITTMASSGAGADGDYSAEMDFATITPWVETAEEEDMYVLLDLQPGRTDFLTQAKLYEELLLDPHVGLALDPEWRLKPGEFHLEQIGSVSAAEVNEVIDWLAELTRENALPQKVLLIHQFDPIMLPDRELIEIPAELAVVIQMDGHGTMELKMSSWNRLTTGDGARFWWGWKNFYDEDLPTPTPEQVLDLEPATIYVSYQ